MVGMLTGAPGTVDNKRTIVGHELLYVLMHSAKFDDVAEYATLARMQILLGSVIFLKIMKNRRVKESAQHR